MSGREITFVACRPEEDAEVRAHLGPDVEIVWDESLRPYQNFTLGWGWFVETTVVYPA